MMKETIEARKALLVQTKQNLDNQYMQQANMLLGAIGECENTLAELNKENDNGGIRRDEVGDAGGHDQEDAFSLGLVDSAPEG